LCEDGVRLGSEFVEIRTFPGHITSPGQFPLFLHGVGHSVLPTSIRWSTI